MALSLGNAHAGQSQTDLTDLTDKHASKTSSSPPVELHKENDSWRISGGFMVQDLADRTFETVSLSGGALLYSSQPFSA